MKPLMPICRKCNYNQKVSPLRIFY
uniref:Uncharacterized protein n=1 Tax=Rhizophora mucronata TaxID=61149 RepID=A0A2P2NER7_RHIMU